ncbi:hypothetical protein ERUR111494_08325 [Erysipelothrix urinaevulpis]|uniref:hypothetical protein n=1 Tax=Erysipelothrix urinaevulpis TaxID=2683717 RepID=UPI0013582976|nr:hypothetical protein [Erysipelothrix urinaevulpis]
MYTWVTGNAELRIVTLNEHNVTLNSNATEHFTKSHYVLVGISDEGMVGVKPVTKKDLELNRYNRDLLHKISVGKAYAKINNKALCDLISKKLGEPLVGQKIVAKYNDQEDVLEFDLNDLGKEGVVL